MKCHNRKRTLHSTDSLKHAEDYAQKWEEHLMTLGSLEHSDGKLNGAKLGENLFFLMIQANLTVTMVSCNNILQNLSIVF